MIERYIRKPVVLQMLLWDGSNSDEVAAFVGAANWLEPLNGQPAKVWNSEERCWIPVPVGHRIVEGLRREFHPISQAALGELYEAVPE